MQRAKSHRSGVQLFGLMAIALVQCAPPPAAPDEVGSTPGTQTQTVPQPSVAQHPWPRPQSPLTQIQVVTIPPTYPINVAVSTGLQTVEEFAADYNALAVINGGFFDPNNGQTTSFVTVNGTLVADPQENRRLVHNPDLGPYLAQILNRSEFRRYQCGPNIRYDITFHGAPLPANCTLHSALGAGPQLLPTDTSQAEAFTDYANGELIRDALGSQRPNARSAIGIKSDGTVVWVLTNPLAPSGGMTLTDLTAFMATLDIQKALNLDGGSSTSLYLDPQNFTSLDHGSPTEPMVDRDGPQLRPVKSVLFLP